jgi:muramoyltetrapeptide carboxypeptidase
MTVSVPFVPGTASSGAVHPPALAPGARVALVAPAGPLRGPVDVERADATVRALGWTPVSGASVLARVGWLAGDDDARLADLQDAIDDPSIDAIWCLRGGHGTTRLLPRLRLGALAAHPKAIVGFSDVTALHAAIAATVPLVTFHGPVARGELTPASRDSLVAALSGSGEPCGHAVDGRTARAGVATGTLAGGNLALLAALCGTPWQPRFRDAIVVLEDVHEPSYRVDRMLRQLEQSGAFDGCAGLVGGQFTDVPRDAAPDAPACDTLVADLARHLDIPCLLGAPIGHIAEQWTVPLGARAELDADARTLRVATPTA